MLRLKWLKINRFRHVEPGTELQFGPSFNVLLGKNAAGKTTLLEVINAAINDDFSSFRSESEGFDIAYEIEAARDNAAHEPSVTLHVSRTPIEAGATGPGGFPSALRGATRFEEAAEMVVRSRADATHIFKVSGRTVSFAGGDSQPVDAEPSSWCFRLELLLKSVERAETEHLLSDVIEIAGAAIRGVAPRFDEADRFLDKIGDLTIREERVHAACWPLELLPKPSDRDGIGDVYRRTSSDVPLLKSMADQLCFESLTVQATLRERTDELTIFNPPRFILKSAGREIGHDLLSFGQRRLLGFLWYLAVRSSSPVVSDELVNGFHHEWIAKAMDTLRGRQSFLATQNPLIIDELPVLGEDEAPTTFLRCECRPGGGEEMRWRNFSQRENDLLVTARRNGIQSVSEVLRFEGLW